MAAAQIDMNLAMGAKTTHVIVEFNSLHQKSAELVLRSWMYSKKGSWYCKYPVGTDMQFAEYYIKSNYAPQEKWKSYKVKILTQAEGYDQGIRRLNRYLDGVQSLNSAPNMVDVLKEKSPDASKGDNINGSKEQTSNVATDIIYGSGSSNQGDQSSSDDTESIKDRSDSLIEEIETTLRQRDISQTQNNQKNKNNQDKQKNRRGTQNTVPLANTCHQNATAVPEVTDATLRESMKHLELNVTKLQKKLSRMQNSIIYEVKEQSRLLKLSFMSAEGLQSVGDTLPKCLETLGADLPLDTFEKFSELDQSLKYEGEDDDQKKIANEKRKALKTWMKLMWNGCKSEKEAAYKVLPAMMTKAVQLQFSGSGRKVKGQGKENFSATKIFEYMADVLVESYSCNKDGIRGIVGKWLSGAGDRDGGKKNRL